jgi:DNA-binding CsgD family transcriptional regulator
MRGEHARSQARRSAFSVGPLESLELSGALAFLFTLSFVPLGLTAQESGDALGMSPFSQTMLTSAVMLATCLACAVAETRTRFDRPRARGILRTGTGVAACVLPLTASALAFAVHAPWVPATVSVLAGTGCVCELWLGIRRWSDKSPSSAETAIAVSLVGASLISLALGVSPLLAYQSAALICAIMGISGCVLVAQDVRDAKGCHDGHVRDPESASVQEISVAAALLRNDWQPVVGSAICALSLGMGWNGASSDVSGATAVYVALGETAGSLVLLALVAWRTRRPDAWSPDSALILAAGIGILVWVLTNDGQKTAPLFALASVSQVMLLGLLLVETQDTGRDLAARTSVTMLGLACFLAAMMLGGALSNLIPQAVSDVVIPVALLAFVGVVLHNARASQSQRQDEERGGEEGEFPSGTSEKAESERVALIGSVLEDACATMAADYGLSQREREILPYLVRGISAPAIGSKLFISPQTVKTHAHRIYAKMEIHSRDELSALFERYMTGEFRIERADGARPADRVERDSEEEG